MLTRMMMTVLMLFFSGLAACGVTGSEGAQIVNGSTVSQEANSSKTLTYTNISPEEAKKRLETEKGIILLDVRTKEENEEKRIPNSLLIPVDVIKQEAPSKLTDKDATIFVYCRSGRRSVTASEALVEMGYTRVYNLGGIIDWPYETESGK